MQLTPVENTAWLTVYCRYLQSRKPRSYLKDKVAEWLVNKTGFHGFEKRIRKSVLMGVPARTAAIDMLIKEELQNAAGKGFLWTYVAIGCGLDARWERLSREMSATVNDYYEVDYRNMLSYKKGVLEGSPFSRSYEQVKQLPGDLKHGLPAGFPATQQPALVVLEGCMMYLDQHEQLLLLRNIKKKLPNAVVILDTYNARAAHIANKRHAQSTGSSQLQFSTAPEDPVQFYSADNWRIDAAISLIKEMYSINRSLLRYIPLPPKIARMYLLIKMR